MGGSSGGLDAMDGWMDGDMSLIGNGFLEGGTRGYERGLSYFGVPWPRRRCARTECTFSREYTAWRWRFTNPDSVSYRTM